MKKPILFILYISFACSIGFICGGYFGSFYNRNIVLETIHNNNDYQKLVESFSNITTRSIWIEELDKIKDMNELDIMKKRHIQNLSDDIGSFEKQVKIFKEMSNYHFAIDLLEGTVAKLESKIININP